MRKAIVGIVSLCLASFALADTYTLSVSTTNGVTATNTIPISGWLDRIEFAQPSAATTTVLVATSWGSTNAAILTLASSASATDDSLVYRPRFLPTTTGAATITNTYHESVGLTNQVATMFVGNYEKVMAGGNLVTKLTGAGGASSASATVQLVFYYEPTKK